MPYRVDGIRLGTKVYTPTGFVLSGAIPEDDNEAIKYLREIGYKLKRCRGIPERKPTEVEIAEMEAADKYLGIHRGPSGTTRLEREIKRGKRDLLAPLRKALRGSLFGRRF